MSPHDDLTDHTLAVIDRTLAGDSVSAQDADLAELTLILAGQRPHRSDAFAAALDAQMARRFAIPASPGRDPVGGGPAGARVRREGRQQWRPRRWLFAPGLAGVAAVVAVIVLVSFGSGSGSHPLSQDLSASPPVLAPQAASRAGAAASTAAQSTTSSASASGTAAATTGSLPAVAAPNRQVIQGAQLTLGTRPSRVDNVAQQVFSVISAQNGVVESSNVTATSGPGGGAEFSLTVPNEKLGPAMAALSQLRGAQVISRNDVSRDVTGRAGGAGRQLADARALRTALLRKLDVATTATSIDSLRLQIHDTNASIASDLATLRDIQRQVANSHIELTISAVTPPSPPHSPSSGGGFTLHRALHDAKRVLVVAAGVGLIALAVLVPAGLLVTLGLGFAHAVRRHRRERVLDLI